MKSDIEIVIEKSKTFEKILRTHFKAKGAGLGKLLDSIPDKNLPHCLRYILRRVAYIRNRVVHGDKGIKDKEDFIEICDAAKFDLDILTSGRNRDVKASKDSSPEFLITQNKVMPEVISATDILSVQQGEPPPNPYVVDIRRVGKFGSDVYKNKGA